MAQIRRATIADVPAIGKIINDCAEFGLMLPRSLASLYENVRDYHVALADDGSNEVIGVCGLAVVWANLAEIYALAVDPHRRGRGLGRQLVQACVAEAEQLGIRKLMTLTYEETFFRKLGFEVVDRQQLPLKVWSECIRCPKNQACDEIAMIHELEHVPELNAPQPESPPPDQYIVPLTLSRLGQAPPPGEND